MRDILITKKRQKTELLSLLACFAVAFCLNVYAIIAYGGEWEELFWSLGFVAVTAVALYVLSAVVRLTIYVIRKWSDTKKR